ncbi:hypothetical protein [Nocardia sp. NBC_01329]|uniref:hypothetical protein n=1 Tax=Nocardia sp. NBC_01329 TaxID=2903594 RepID=UPI002E10EF25|nr:hypothetical protein OG405_04435 [Nocardia sp. NBC_01329]
MLRSNRAQATRRATARIVVAGAITLLPLAALAAPAMADQAAPAPGYTQVDRDRHGDRDRDHHRDRDRDRDHHRDRDGRWDRDDRWDRDHHRDRHGDRGWEDPANWARHLLRGLFGSS